MKRAIVVVLLFVGLFAVLKHQGAFAAWQPPTSQAGANPWQDITRAQLNSLAGARTSNLVQARSLRLNRGALTEALQQAPRERTAAARTNPVLLPLPYPDGSFKTFRVVEAPIMEPGLAAKFPELKTYVADSPDDPTASARLDLTPQGFHALILSDKTSIYIDPALVGNADYYQSYFKTDVRAAEGWECGTVQDAQNATAATPGRRLAPVVANGGNLRTFRLAVAATGEYTAFHGGTVVGALAAITTSVNRINAVYERDLAVRLVLVANNNLIVYTNAATDPYTNSNNATMLGENQTNLDSVIGAANYDIGHVFNTFSGGLALAGVVCNNGRKAQGASGLTSPVGDGFDVRIVAHEIGHQFGAHHTFNTTAGNCNGNRTPLTAYEPGSGSTIMSYAGVCAPDDLQAVGDDYFHVISLEEMTAYLNSFATCATTTTTGNTPPAVIAGASYTIPISTPFTLTAAGNDANGDALTYSWEQYNLGAPAPPNTDEGARPIFRSFLPTTNPARTFPQLNDILNNTTTLGESLPTTTRTLTFQVTARDNRAGGGALSTDMVAINTASTAGPFTVTSPNTAVSWAGGSTQTVTWNVANTNASPVNCANVKISLSLNGGLTFPVTLLASTPNTGSAVVTLPQAPTTQARIKVEAVNNIFFDVSNVNFSITSICIPGTATVSGGGAICAGGMATVTVNVTGGVSPVTVKLSNGQTQTGTFGQTVFNFTVNPAVTTTYTLAAGSQDAFGCALNGSGSALVQVASITPGTSPAVAVGTTSAPLPYTFTGSLDQYSIDYDTAANTAGFVDVTNAALSVSPLTLTIPGAAAAGTYNATLAARNSTSGCVTAALPFTVTLYACPTQFTVNHLGDTPDTNPGNRVCADSAGNCTLRAALMEANALTMCAALTINFSVNGTVNLANALPEISRSLTITGPGAHLLTVRRNVSTAFRIFDIPVSGKDVVISGLTISNGNAGSDFGGGIESLSKLTLTDCALTGNRAVGGGGVSLFFADGVFTGCTFSFNTGDNQGGGINFYGSGHTLRLTNCTISNNLVGGNGVGAGIFNLAVEGNSALEVTNCTIASNTTPTQFGGGIATANSGTGIVATTRLRNTLLAGNTLPSLRTINIQGSTGTNAVISLGHNLTSDDGNNFLNQPTDKPNTDPLLGALANNGGPTQTHALLSGSPAIGVGNNCVLTNACASNNLGFNLTTDQRGAGFPRGVNTVDIGAFEVQPGPADHLAFGVQPSNAAPGATITPAVTVQVLDASNSVVTSSTATIALAFGNNPSGATLGGTTSVAAVNGVAMFGNLSVNLAGMGYTLATSSSGLTGATSQPFNIVFVCPTITVNPTNGTLTGGTVGTVYSQTFTQTGGTGMVAFSQTAGALPDGLTLSAGGVLSGTPTVAGTFNFTITATDGNNCTGSQAYQLMIGCPTITVGTPANAMFGVSYNSSVAASPLPGGFSYQYSLANATTLPPGLMLNASTGAITGTPSLSGTFNFDIKAELFNPSNGATGCSTTQTRTITVTCSSFTIGTPTPTGALGVAYSSSVAATPPATGGNHYQYSLANGTSLPSGLTLDANTGALTGTPTVGGMRNFDIQVELLDASNASTGCSNTQTRTITITCPSFTVGTPTASGAVSSNYSSSVAASPAAPAGYSYQYTLANGTTLPPGLTLEANTGAITGTLDLAGTYNFDIRVELFNAVNQPTGCSVTQPRTITVTCPPSPVMPAPNPLGAPGVLYFSSVGLGFSSGISYQYALANGTVLPPGLSLNTFTGGISGTPTTTGTFTFDVKVSGYGAGCSTTQTFTIQVVSCVNNPVVNNLNDSGPGSLRAAVATACPGTTVRFQAALTGMLTLTSGDLLITQSLTVEGPGAHRVTISGNNTSRVFYLHDGPNDVTIAGLSLVNGNSNGLINSGEGGALYIRNQGTTTLREVSISGSTAAIGGGIEFETGSIAATLNLIRCTLTGNTVTFSGGGIDIRSYGVLNVINSTLAGNQAPADRGGAIGNSINTRIRVNLVNSTVTDNQGGGIQDLANLVLVARNSLLTGNTGPDYSGGGGGLFSMGYNLIGNSGGGGPVFLHPTDQVGVNPLLELDGNGKPKLALNGGPTQTIRPLPGSPALDRGGAAPYNEAQVVALFASGGTYTLSFNGQTTPALPYNASSAALQAALNALSTIGGVGGNVTVTQSASHYSFGSSITSVVRFGGALAGSDQPLLEAATADSFYLEVKATVDGGPFSPLSTDQRGLTRPVDLAGVPNASGGDGSDIGAYEHGCSGLTLGVLPNGVPGSTYNQTIAVNGGGAPYAITHTGGTLPPGLMLANGVLSGIPTQAGTFSFTLSVTDGYGCLGSQTYSLSFGCPSLALAPATLPNGVQGTAYNQTLTTSPTGGNYSYAVTTGTLPPGLTLASDGTLSGTPSAGGSYAFAITATGWGACTTARTYNLLVTGTCTTITVNPASLPAGALGALYSQTLSATGGTAPYSYSIAVGALPAGLSLNANTGELSGTPTASGSFSFTVRATGQGGCTGQRAYVLSIGCGTLTFTPVALPSATKGVAYSQAISVGSASATFSLLLGSLPPGLTLSSSGLLSGTTTQTGTYNLTVKAIVGSCQGTKAYSLIVGTGTAALALSGDYDGDGKSDPALWSANDGTWRIVRSSNGQSINQRWGTAGDITLLGDYDGDGKSDLAVFRPSDATFYMKRSSDGQNLVKQWGLSTDVPVPGDYDGDGKTDIAVWRGSNGTWYIVRSSDGQYEVQAWGAGYAPYSDVPVAGDYDGDGKSDVAVFRRATGTWLIKRSRDGQYLSKIWGLGTDVPVANDYDGDGQTDIAVWRGSTWYIWQSASNSYRTETWGTSAAPSFDQAAPGDYDGDGLADVAVWRAGEQAWYVRGSLDGSLRRQAQGRAGDVPVGPTSKS